MPIEQEHPPEPTVPSQFLVTSLDPPRDLEYPHTPISAKTGKAVMPLILWSLGLLFGILMLLVRMPINAPEFEQLTQYVCDPLPYFPGLGNRLQSYPLTLKCRAGDKVVYQRGLPTYSNNPAWTPCRRAGGLIRIWRVASPSPYSSYVFHATCDEHVITYYRDRAKTYESTQRFVIAVACIVVLASLTGLLRQLFHGRRRRSSSAQDEFSQSAPRSEDQQ